VNTETKTLTKPKNDYPIQ